MRIEIETFDYYSTLKQSTGKIGGLSYYFRMRGGVELIVSTDPNVDALDCERPVHVNSLHDKDLWDYAANPHPGACSDGEARSTFMACVNTYLAHVASNKIVVNGETKIVPNIPEMTVEQACDFFGMEVVEYPVVGDPSLTVLTLKSKGDDGVPLSLGFETAKQGHAFALSIAGKMVLTRELDEGDE